MEFNASSKTVIGRSQLIVSILVLATTTVFHARKAASQPSVSQPSTTQGRVDVQSSASSHDNEGAIEFNIPSGPLSNALTTFSFQAHTPLTSQAPALAGKVSPGLHGRYTPSDALGLLLAGSGLTYGVVGGHAYQIMPASSAIMLGPVRVGGRTRRPFPLQPSSGTCHRPLLVAR